MTSVPSPPSSSPPPPPDKKRSRGDTLVTALSTASPIQLTPRRQQRETTHDVATPSQTATSHHLSPTELSRRLDGTSDKEKRHRTERIATLRAWVKSANIIKSENIIINFDGGCRKGKEILSSSACFIISYDCPLSKGQIVSATTNQQAEICGLLDALNTPYKLHSRFSLSGLESFLIGRWWSIRRRNTSTRSWTLSATKQCLDLRHFSLSIRVCR